jgi:hypothetical protein
MIRVGPRSRVGAHEISVLEHGHPLAREWLGGKNQPSSFPDGVVWSSEGFGTHSTHSIFSLLLTAESEESVLVGPEGFEPPTKGL